MSKIAIYKICKCGCKNKVSHKKEYITNHEKQEIIKCACGCGQTRLKYDINGYKRINLLILYVQYKFFIFYQVASLYRYPYFSFRKFEDNEA